MLARVLVGGRRARRATAPAWRSGQVSPERAAAKAGMHGE